MWQAAFKGATHCGAGCALGDFIGDWLAFTLGLQVLGSDLAMLCGFVTTYPVNWWLIHHGIKEKM